jgi:LysM domain
VTERPRKTTPRRRKSAAPKAAAPAEPEVTPEPTPGAEPTPDAGFAPGAGIEGGPDDEDLLDARPPAARTVTPAVIGAAAFVVVCALASIAFVAGRGGLALPIASPSAPPVAIASPSASPPASAPPMASPSPPAATPSAVPVSPGPTTAPSSTPAPPPDPLAALPPCPDRPGCYVYTVRRGDRLARIATRFEVPYDLVLALNPEISNPSVIVVGQPVYLGRSLFVRLEPCPNRDGCHLYVVQPGDRLSAIANRYGLSVAAILELNPAIDDPNTIYSGQVIRLPDPTT